MLINPQTIIVFYNTSSMSYDKKPLYDNIAIIYTQAIHYTCDFLCMTNPMRHY